MILFRKILADDCDPDRPTSSNWPPSKMHVARIARNLPPSTSPKGVSTVSSALPPQLPDATCLTVFLSASRAMGAIREILTVGSLTEPDDGAGAVTGAVAGAPRQPQARAGSSFGTAAFDFANSGPGRSRCKRGPVYRLNGDLPLPSPYLANS